MENINGLINLLSARIEKILRKETALTPDDINAVKELSEIIVNLGRLHLLENQYVLAGKSGRASQRLSRGN